MPMAGAKPKADRTQIRHRVPPAHDWTEVERIPFDGPLLPDREVGWSIGRPLDVDNNRWPRATQRWWEAVRTMPHAKLWTPTDWEFAFATAETHARFTEGWKGANGAELRGREKLLGNTMDARRDMRIRYVDPKPVSDALPADVVDMANYRDL